MEISNPVNWLPKWKQRGFKLPEITSKIDFTKEGLSASRALRNESRIPPEVKVPQSFIDGDLGVKILDNGNLWGNARCEIMQIDFLHDKTLMNIIEKFKSKLAQNKNATEEEKINLLMNYVDDLFSVSKNDGEILKLTEKFPANKVVNLGEIIDSGAGVCRHRALLLKILGDKSNMSVSLVKGCYDDGHHAWNEIITKSGKKYLVDPMHRNVINLNDASLRDLRVLSYQQGHSGVNLYARDCAETQKLYNHIWGLTDNEAMSLGGRAKLYKPNGEFALYPEVNQEVFLNGKVLDQGRVLKDGDMIEYLNMEGNPTKIIWKSPVCN